MWGENHVESKNKMWRVIRKQGNKMSSWDAKEIENESVKPASELGKQQLKNYNKLVSSSYSCTKKKLCTGVMNNP